MLLFGCTGNAEDKNVPTLVQGLAGHKIVGAELGSGDAHTLALEDNGKCTVRITKIKGTLCAKCSFST